LPAVGDTKRTSARTARARTAATKTTAKKQARPTANGSDNDSRQRVIKATIDCIVDLGYYQATSNEIARRAGVSWGVIQYYFGTRENLLVAVIEDACATTLAELEQVEIAGETTAEKLDSWMECVFAFYSQPGYIAILQILWDVLRRPGTAEESKRTLLQWQGDLQARQAELLAQVAGDRAVEHMQLMYSTTWGLAVAEAFGKSYADVLGTHAPLPRNELVEAFAVMIDRETPKRPTRRMAKKKTASR
jgi:AcrR family transcriptional regulator